MPPKRKRGGAESVSPAEKRSRATRGSTRRGRKDESSEESELDSHVLKDDDDDDDDDVPLIKRAVTAKKHTKKTIPEPMAVDEPPVAAAVSSKSLQGAKGSKEEDTENLNDCKDLDHGSESDSVHYETSSESDSDASSGTGGARRLPKRGTRGQRFSQLVGEELEADQSFWGQKAWADVEDDDYVFEKQKDIIDSDFDAEESEGESDVDGIDKAKRGGGNRSKKGKVGKYQDPALKQRAHVSRGAPKPRSVRGPATAQPRVHQQRIFRISTAMNSSESAAARARAAAEALKRASTKTVAPVVEQMTQAQLLEVASHTELDNKRKLEVMLQMQFDKRARSAPKAPYAGPVVRFHSSLHGGTTYTFTEVNAVPAVINSKPRPYPKKKLCAITGLPAKYRDPLTGKYYANLEAFKAIRAETSRQLVDENK